MLGILIPYLDFGHFASFRWVAKGAFFWAYSGIGTAGMIRISFLFVPELITDMSEPVNSVTIKVLHPLWNQSSPRTNNCLAYSNYSYSGIRIAGMIRIILPFRAWVDYRHVRTSVTMKVLQPLWNESSPRTNNCLAYSNYSYSAA